MGELFRELDTSQNDEEVFRRLFECSQYRLFVFFAGDQAGPIVAFQFFKADPHTGKEEILSAHLDQDGKWRFSHTAQGVDALRSFTYDPEQGVRRWVIDDAFVSRFREQAADLEPRMTQLIVEKLGAFNELREAS